MYGMYFTSERSACSTSEERMNWLLLSGKCDGFVTFHYFPNKTRIQLEYLTNEGKLYIALPSSRFPAQFFLMMMIPAWLMHFSPLWQCVVRSAYLYVCDSLLKTWKGGYTQSNVTRCFGEFFRLVPVETGDSRKSLILIIAFIICTYLGLNELHKTHQMKCE